MDKHTILTEITLAGPRRTVWAYITDQYNLRRLVEGALGAGVEFANTASPYEGQALPLFRASTTGGNLLLSGDGCSIAVRVAQEGEGCKIIAAASFSDGAAVMPTKKALDNLLDRVRRDTGTHAAVTGEAPGPAAAELRRTQGEQEKKKPAEKTARGRKAAKAALALAACIALVLLALRFAPSLKPKPQGGAGAPDGYSEKVTLNNVLALSVGDSESDVKKALGTSGVSQNGARLYTGSADGGETYGILVQVRYNAGKAERITYLNTVQCIVSGSFEYAAGYDAMGAVSVIETAMGRPASMVRILREQDADITEIHFGYLDPFSNFDSAWRGEYVVVQDKTAGMVAIRYWAATSGSDPLIIPQLAGYPAEKQYDDYTTYLDDKYTGEKALFMLGGYSKGDVVSLFGEYELYSTDAGVALNSLDSPELLADGTPAFRMSFGFDSRGQFVLCSYSNMRLMFRQDMLSETKYTEVTRGMSYNEVRDLMGILPTAIVIDKSYFTLCYGARLDSEVFEEQFEFMVKFDIDNNYAQNLWDNTARNW